VSESNGQRQSGDFVSANHALPALPIDASDWPRGAGPRTAGDLVSANRALPGVKVNVLAVEIRTKIAVAFPASCVPPTWEPFGISTIEAFADWLDAKYHLMIAWTGYDPTLRHGRVLIFEKFKGDDYIYDPNTRRANLATINSRGQTWFGTLEFFAYCLHEMAHDFMRFDEEYCQQRVGIEPLSYSQYVQSNHKKEIDNLVESLCEYFKKRMLF
jgi:hypothetical protein